MKIKLEFEVDTEKEHDVEVVEKLVELIQNLNTLLEDGEYDE